MKTPGNFTWRENYKMLAHKLIVEILINHIYITQTNKMMLLNFNNGIHNTVILANDLLHF